MLTRYHIILVLASIVAFLSLTVVIILVTLWSVVLTPFQDYALVVDDGSTHSKSFLYTWPADKSNGLGNNSRINQVTACDIGGEAVSLINISSQDNVKQYFDEAITKCINEIPLTRKSRTLIFLGATVRRRLYNITDPVYITKLLTDIRTYFSSFGLSFHSPENQVRIISGVEKGLSGWISSNSLMKQLFYNNQPLETYGVLEVDGMCKCTDKFCSTNTTDKRYTMNLFGTNYDVYSHSYLCYGQEQTCLIYQGTLIQQGNGSLVINDPCLQTGYNQTISYGTINNIACAVNRYTAPDSFNSQTKVTFRGTGNYSECQTNMHQYFNKSCSYSSCGINNVYQPVPIPSLIKLLAIAAVYRTFVALAPNVTILSDSNNNYNLVSTNLTQINAALERICNQPWTDLVNPETKNRPLLCFYSMYHWTLFKFDYSMTDNNFQNLQLIKTIDSNDIGWTLGYMINQANYLDAEHHPARLLTQTEFIGVIICFLVLLVGSIITIIISIMIDKQCQKLVDRKWYK